MPSVTGRRATGLRVTRRFRLATREARILPSFLIIGAQRAGTTSLLHYLRGHPDVAGPTAGEHFVRLRKEVHFFDSRFSEGVDWYRSFFPLSVQRRLARARGRDLVAGESTPYYLFHPQVPERVAATLPDARLIALLRNPVERAYSHYQMMRRRGRETRSFAKAIAAEERHLLGKDEAALLSSRPHHYHHRAYVMRGLYAAQLERWLAHFPREQLLVLRSEDFFERPAEVYEEVRPFLGLRPWELDSVKHDNKASYSPIAPELRTHLEERFAEPNERLAELLGRDFRWDRAERLETSVSQRER